VRALIVNSERGIAGGLSSSIELAEGLARRGHDLTVACHPSSRLRERLEKGGQVRIAPVAIRAELNAWRAVQIAALLRRIRPDVIIADRRKDLKLSFAARLLAPGAGLVHRHGAPSPLRDSPVYRSIWTRIDAMVVNSFAMLHRLRRETPWIAAIPLHVIHNGKDLDRYRPDPDRRTAARRALNIEPDAFVLCYHGVLQARKNLPSLFEAVARAGAGPALHVLVIGDGPDAATLRGQAARLGVAATFTGLRTDVPELLAAADAAVHLSSAEGFSNSVIEAMACGLPVIASRAASHDEQIDDGINGVLVDALDVTAITAAIDRLCADTDLTRRMGVAARTKAVSAFGIESMLDAWERVLAEALDARASAG
jgi:glycosyltransferase involved in cell wall biosynthesis